MRFRADRADGNDLSNNSLKHALLKRSTNGGEHLRKILHDELRGDSQNAIPGAPELLIPSRVSARTPRVIAAINLNDQPLSGREEIHDETEHRDLATEFNAGLPGAKRCPDRGFRVGGSLTHAMSVSGED